MRFKDDFVAGLTTATIVIPMAMAYTTIAGLPVEVGLYTAFVPPIVYALLGTSSMLSVSSTTTLAILSAAALGEITRQHPSASLAGATATLCLLVGAILAAARVFRVGYVANFISDPVLTGFKTGIGLVIVIDQVPKLLGVHIQKEGFFRDVVALAGQLPQSSLATVAVAAGTFAVILLCQRLAPRAPAPLVAVAGGIAAAIILGLKEQGVSVVGSIPGGLPSLSLPDLSLARELWPAALGIALMSFTESIAAGRAFARPGDPQPDSNRELFALGACNAVAGFFGAMPSGGGTSQTNVNRNGGARTQVAGLVTAGTALATMLFLAPAMGAMPHATLAAVVIVNSIGLVKLAEIEAIRKVRSLEFHWAVAAFLGVVLLGTLKGILVAVILSMASLFRLANNPALRVMGRIPNTHFFRPRTDEHPEDESFPGLLIVRPEGRIYFGNAATLAAKLRAEAALAKPRVVLLDCGAVPDVEYTAIKMLIDGEARLREAGVELWLAALNPEARELVRRTVLEATLGDGRMFRTVEQAVAAYEKRSSVPQ